MVVPDSTSIVQQADHGGSSGLLQSSEPGYEEEQVGVELEEVRKLQELVRRLEVQNQTLRNRGGKNRLHGAQLHGRTGNNSNNITAGVGTNINERLSCEGGVTNNSRLRLDHSSSSNTDLEQLSPPLDSSSSEDMSPVPTAAGRLEDEEDEEEEEEDYDDDDDEGPCGGFAALPYGNGPTLSQGQSPTADDSPCQDSYESETLADSDSGVDQTALDELDVLDLEDECAEVQDEDSWLYVSPKKQAADMGPESPLKWCRQVLDHPSPETEVARRTLMTRLDHSSRWRNMYSSPSGDAVTHSSGLTSPGYHKSTNKSTLLTCGNSGLMGVHSALSSQSSIDSELSTSDDSISMGYKLQDLTDVQIMARLQEESLRQDYATSNSASASRRSSCASLQSLRRGGGGTYSDQEFDSFSLEDEEDECGSLPQRRHRFTPSPLGSPRCLSPSTSNHGQGYPPARTRVPRRSLQGPSPELLKFAKSEEELRHSMPNLAPRTSLRSLEAVRNSRSMEANLQSSGNRMSRLTHSPSTGMTNSRLRANGQSPLSMRAPVKAMTPVGSMAAARQQSRGLPVIQGTTAGGGVRRVQSPGPAGGGGGAYPVGRASAGTGRPVVGRGQVASSPNARSRIAQPSRRSLGMTKMSDESWKDGCY